MSIQQHKAEGRKEDSGQLMYIAHQYKALRKSCLGKADRTSTFLLAFFCARHHTSMAVLQWYKNKPFAETPVAKIKIQKISLVSTTKIRHFHLLLRPPKRPLAQLRHCFQTAANFATRRQPCCATYSQNCRIEPCSHHEV